MFSISTLPAKNIRKRDPSGFYQGRASARSIQRSLYCTENFLVGMDLMLGQDRIRIIPPKLKIVVLESYIANQDEIATYFFPKQRIYQF